jgi:hypothetical protein
MESLNTQTILTTFSGQPQLYQSGGTFKMEVPQSNVMVAKPLTYEFRVAEYTDAKGDVVKVGLQMQAWEHDNYGTATLKKPWFDVKRVKIPYTG